MSKELTAFTDIKELYSFASLSKKAGRKPLDEDLKPQKNVCMVVGQGKILWVGPQKSAAQHLKSKFPHSRVKWRSLENQRVYPGFVEAHTHMVFAGDRSEEFEWRQSGVSYAEISARGGGILSTVKAVSRAKESELFQTAQRRLKRYLRQGVTTLEVKTGYGLNTSQELKLLRVIEALKGPRIVPCFLGAHALPLKYKGRPEDYLFEVTLPTLKKVHQQHRCRRVDIFVEEGFFDLATARRFFEEAHKLGFRFTIHAEQLTRQGATEMVVGLNGLSLDHGVHLSKKDVSQLADSEVTSVLLPAADFYIKCPYPPARELIDSGARVALATDFNPGTSPTQDLAFVGLLARLEMKMTLAEVWAGYTLNAAWALGLEKECGSLEVGKSADFIVSDSGPHGFFYEVGHTPVLATYVRGRQIRV